MSAGALGHVQSFVVQNLTVAGARVLRSGTSVAIVPAAGTVGATGGTALRFVRITDKAGTAAPYLYSGVQVAHDGGDDFGSEHWEPVSGGLTFNGNIVNRQEIGPNAAGTGPLDQAAGDGTGGAIVEVTTMANGRYCCSAFTGRGTFS